MCFGGWNPIKEATKYEIGKITSINPKDHLKAHERGLRHSIADPMNAYAKSMTPEFPKNEPRAAPAQISKEVAGIQYGGSDKPKGDSKGKPKVGRGRLTIKRRKNIGANI